MRTELAMRIALGRSPSTAVAQAWQVLRATNGTARIEHLVAESGMSHRHFIARFRDEIGVTPKQMARVLRFEHAMDLLTRTGASVTGTALAAGYCDQAHLSRDFRALGGSSPGMLLAAHRARGS
ncbi:helix-turn-helix domain-containing protein [Streptomyces sp. H10-C2]|uniref:helix-turn-helix domain-containing protein n=1 Tax=unclassified Streptomyces TaxID=2593676 RepID=UPI0024BA88D0|nr:MULTISPECIES: helix-turn-helix domain-containing protein [unclassified Streptomyces]MDJ0347118.1 helix-turn-helix domain-containing protein [Streptomyces sp. PH10-H1]MDJ0375333.1 helix-turn-helix domain-containing protein [Streptomyces sp. H10-C2]